MNEDQITHAIYQLGASGVHGSVTNGRVDFSGHGKGPDLTVAEYLKELWPMYVCLSWDEACERAENERALELIGPWKEIDVEQWDDAFECLPPMRMGDVDGILFFQMSEMTSGTITCTYARRGDQCFTAYRRISDSYQTMAEDINDTWG